MHKLGLLYSYQPRATRIESPIVSDSLVTIVANHRSSMGRRGLGNSMRCRALAEPAKFSKLGIIPWKGHLRRGARRGFVEVDVCHAETSEGGWNIWNRTADREG